MGVWGLLYLALALALALQAVCEQEDQGLYVTSLNMVVLLVTELLVCGWEDNEKLERVGLGKCVLPNSESVQTWRLPALCFV